MDEQRRAGRRIAESYDAFPYETPDDPALRPRAVLGFGGVFGCAAGLKDVLDLGCGNGVQLDAAAAEMTGRVTGVDLSGRHCRRAAARLARWGSRAQMQQVDLLDLTPDDLGRFDLIYAVGLVYAVPPAVRAHALALIGACLKPGGVALVSHYAGTIAAARSHLHRQLRAETPDDPGAAVMVARAREILARLSRTLEPMPLMQEAARLTASLSDSTFFHEVFNPFCEPVLVRELDNALAPSDVRFLGHLEAPASTQLPDPVARARESDTQDLLAGGYHYAVFGKAARAPDITAPAIVWTTTLRQQDGTAYRVGETQNIVQIAHAPTRAALERIAGQPLPFLEAAPEQERDVTLQLFKDMWARRLVTPLRRA